MQNYNPDEQPAKISASIKPVRLAYGPEHLQFGDLYLPNQPGSHSIVILIHGGYWRARYGLDLMNELAGDLAKRGYAAWNIEYRRIGNPGGGWPGTFQDVAVGAGHLRVIAPQYNLDLGRVAAIGHSAGGPAGVLDLRRAWELGLSDNVVEEFLGGTPRQVPERYASASPIQLVPLG